MNVPKLLEWDGRDWVARDDYDALAERVDALHNALREHVLMIPSARIDDDPIVTSGCLHCGCRWAPSLTEDHESSCLARPSTPPTDVAI